LKTFSNPHDPPFDSLLVPLDKIAGSGVTGELLGDLVFSGVMEDLLGFGVGSVLMGDNEGELVGSEVTGDEEGELVGSEVTGDDDDGVIVGLEETGYSEGDLVSFDSLSVPLDKIAGLSSPSHPTLASSIVKLVKVGSDPSPISLIIPLTVARNPFSCVPPSHVEQSPFFPTARPTDKTASLSSNL